MGTMPTHWLLLLFPTAHPKGRAGVRRARHGLFDRNRGTNDVENSHKQIVSTFGGWHASIRFSDDLHDERRHRLNHGISERKRPGFPVIGHFDDWLIDQLQNLVFLNHGVVFTQATNATDYIDTHELFGLFTHSAQLGEKLSKFYYSCGEEKFTPDMTYICNRMDIPAPFLQLILTKKKVFQEARRSTSERRTSSRWLRLVR